MVWVLPVPGGPYSRMPLRVDCPSSAQLRAASDKIEDVAVEQSQGGFGQDHVLASNRRQFVHHDASRASPIIGVAIERQHLAAIAARGVDGTLQLGETALHELRAIGAGRQGNLDPGPGLTVILPMRGEHDRVAQAAGLAEPQAVVEAFHRRDLADIHLVVLRRRDSVGIAAACGQCRDGQRLVAVCFVDAEEPDRRRREQPVDRRLERRRAYVPGNCREVATS